MVAHRHPSGACIGHASDKPQRADLMSATVDQVTDEDRGARWVPPCPRLMMVAELLEQGFKPISVAVHIADYVIGHQRWSPFMDLRSKIRSGHIAIANTFAL